MFKRSGARSGFNWRTAVAVVWLLFSVSLSIWWVIFGLNQVEKMKALGGNVTVDLVRHHRMLIWEGSVLVLCLLAGGGTLLYYIRKERLHSMQIKQFFATFTHELKTALASLRLQAECLEEDLERDLKGSPSAELLARLKNDTVRLELQLENSLFVAQADSNLLIFKDLDLRKLLQSVARHWPDLQVHINGDLRVRADERALESIFKNLVQNSVVHGGATAIDVRIAAQGTHIETVLSDNGAGFNGDLGQLGRLFHRHYSKSGSGVGLYLSRNLARKMNGDLRFISSASGFVATLSLQGADA